MSVLTVSIAALGGAALLVHALSVLLAARRLTDSPAVPSLGALPPVSIIRPVCGLTDIDKVALHSAFRLDYPEYEIVLCADREDDAAVPFCRDLVSRYPHVPARLLVGRTFRSANPKLDNVDKGWVAARHDWIVMADCNVLMPSGYLQTLLAGRADACGLVCAPPLGVGAEGLFAEVESAFLNTYQARWQYAADAIGLGFAQGKSMLWHRSFLDAHGGIRALASEVAEDAAATKLVRAAGLLVRLAPRPSLQPLGRRTMLQVWQRQLRWAQLRRQSFPREFALEILTTVAIPLASAFLIAAAQGGLLWLAPLVTLAIWFGAELWLAWLLGWELTLSTVPAMLIRECVMLAVWCNAWRAGSYVWHGQQVSLASSAVATVAK